MSPKRKKKMHFWSFLLCWTLRSVKQTKQRLRLLTSRGTHGALTVLIKQLPHPLKSVLAISVEKTQHPLCAFPDWIYHYLYFVLLFHFGLTLANWQSNKRCIRSKMTVQLNDYELRIQLTCEQSALLFEISCNQQLTTYSRCLPMNTISNKFTAQICKRRQKKKNPHKEIYQRTNSVT